MFTTACILDEGVANLCWSYAAQWRSWCGATVSTKRKWRHTTTIATCFFTLESGKTSPVVETKHLLIFSSESGLKKQMGIFPKMFEHSFKFHSLSVVTLQQKLRHRQQLPYPHPSMTSHQYQGCRNITDLLYSAYNSSSWQCSNWKMLYTCT